MAEVVVQIPPDELSRMNFPCPSLPHDEPSIRLLTLFPGVCAAGGDPIRCSLQNYIWSPETGLIEPSGSRAGETASHNLQPRSDRDLSIPSQDVGTNLSYEALSYTWGDDDQLYRITINDESFPVTLNLLQALIYLRDESCTRTLWIDAVCINQFDVIDKGSQIRQMHRIYQHAYRVIIWLGISTENSDLAFDFIAELYDCFPLAAKGGSEGEVADEYGTPPPFQDLAAQTSHLMIAEKAREWLALHRLFQRPYWARVWIFPELLMARETLVVCGMKCVKWGPIDTAMRIVIDTGQQIPQLINSSWLVKNQQTLNSTNDQNPHYWSLNNSKWLFGLSGGRCYMKGRYGSASASLTMERWLNLINDRLCKYQHDKIYSILGIVSEAVAKLVPAADYSQPAQHVFKQAVRAFIYGTGSLNILCYSHHTDTQDDLPSWTFDWRRQPRLYLLHDIAWGIGTGSQRDWHASALRQHPPQFSDDISILSVQGIVLGTVQSVKIENEILPGLEKHPWNKLDVDADGNPTCHHSSHIVQSWDFNKDTMDALSLILRPHSHLVLEDAISTLLYILLLRRDPSRLNGSAPKNKSPDFAQALDDSGVGFVMRLQVMAKCRTVVETDTLELALAPFWTRPGDIICQFIGCTAPVVLRPQQGNKHSFVGDCYVFQKMGQAMIEILEEAIKKPDGLRRFDLI